MAKPEFITIMRFLDGDVITRGELGPIHHFRHRRKYIREVPGTFFRDVLIFIRLVKKMMVIHSEVNRKYENKWKTKEKLRSYCCQLYKRRLMTTEGQQKNL